MVHLAPLFVAVPMGTAFLCLLVKAIAPRVAGWLSVVSAAGLLLLSILALLSGESGAVAAGRWGVVSLDGVSFLGGIVVVLDGLSRLFLLTVAVVSAAVVVYGVAYMKPYTSKPMYHSLLWLMIAGMNGVVISGDLFNVFVFLEIGGIASYALVAYGTRGEEVEASFKYLVLGSVASTAVLIAIAVVYSTTGALNMVDVSRAIAAGKVPDAALFFVSALFFAGFGLKAAMMPFHAWLPDAHPSAPAPISAMLSGLLIKTLGIYAIIRVFYTVLGMGWHAQVLLLGFGSLSMIGGVFLALGQDDLKRLLAYHSISQMGFVFVALGVNTTLGLVAGLFHAVNHALFKSALFLSSGSLERIAGTRKLSEMGGLARRAPCTSLATIGAALSISGIPPFNGFWSKLLIIVALVSVGHIALAGIAGLTALMTLMSFIKVQRKALFGPLPERLAGVRDVSPVMYVPVLVLAALCLATGILWPLGLREVLGEAASAAGNVGDYMGLVLGGR
jgi:multicomponent Na+:H+ antiporter subunit D